MRCSPLFTLTCRLLMTVSRVGGLLVSGVCKLAWYGARGRHRRVFDSVTQTVSKIGTVFNNFVDECRYGGSPAVQRVGRSMFRRIFWIPLVITFVALVVSMTFAMDSSGRRASAPPRPPTVLMWAFCGWLLLGRPIAYLLVPFFVTSLSCPGCDEEIDAVSVWKCRCGFHPHYERHVLAGRCPKCGKSTEHINCPRCQCTILLW
jgi:hypothetical protein